MDCDTLALMAGSIAYFLSSHIPNARTSEHRTNSLDLYRTCGLNKTGRLLMNIHYHATSSPV